MNRSEAPNGAIYNGFASTATKVHKAAGYEFPVGGATISALLDGEGNDVLATYFGSETAIPAGVKIMAPDGEYFSSITGSAGGVNIINA